MGFGVVGTTLLLTGICSPEAFPGALLKLLFWSAAGRTRGSGSTALSLALFKRKHLFRMMDSQFETFRLPEDT